LRSLAIAMCRFTANICLVFDCHMYLLSLPSDICDVLEFAVYYQSYPNSVYFVAVNKAIYKQSNAQISMSLPNTHTHIHYCIKKYIQSAYGMQ